MTRAEEIIIAGTNWYARVDSNYPAVSAFNRGAEWADKHQPSPWISVEDRLPEKSVRYISQSVLCRYKRGSRIYYHVGMYDYEFDEWSISNVTHWMPIPELNKEEKQ